MQSIIAFDGQHSVAAEQVAEERQRQKQGRVKWEAGKMINERRERKGERQMASRAAATELRPSSPIGLLIGRLPQPTRLYVMNEENKAVS